MIIVNVFTDDKQDPYRCTLLVWNSKFPDGDFKEDWGKAVLRAIQDRPGEWCADDVYAALRRWGWYIIHAPTVDVAY